MTKPAAFLLAVVCTAAFAQGAYRWVDKDGKVHYSDEAPPPNAQKVEQKRLGASVIGSESLPYQTRHAAANFPVVLYVSGNCGDGCAAARTYLAARGIPHAEKVVTTADDLEAFRKATQSGMMPTLQVGSMVGKGFLESEWAALLDAAGYPPGKAAER
jgi:hypothetical protein